MPVSEPVPLLRTPEDFARMVVTIARSTPVDSILCAAESGLLLKHVREAAAGLRLIAATHTKAAHDRLLKEGYEVIHLPIYVSSKFKQAEHMVAVAFQNQKVSTGETIECVIGHTWSEEGGDLIVVMDVDTASVELAPSELIKLADGIRPSVLEAALKVACKIGQAARRGKRIGALLTLGDERWYYRWIRTAAFRSLRPPVR